MAGSHDSVADAAATMELALLKFRNGPAFGETRPDGPPVVGSISAAGKRASLVDRSRALVRLTTGSANAVEAAGDADGAAKAVREARNPRTDFVWLNLGDLAAYHEQKAAAARRAAAGEEGAVDASAMAAAEIRILRAADAAVGAVAAGVPDGTLLMVATGHGDTAEARRLQESKWRRKQGLGGAEWREEDDAALMAAGARAKNGLGFVKILGGAEEEDGEA